MNRIYAIAAVILVVGLGGFWWMSTQQPAPGLDVPSAANAQSADFDQSLAPDMVIGNPDSSVEVIEYASFTCPHCAAFHAGTFKDLKADYIDTGKIKFVHREVYFDKYGLWAGMLARCGGTEEKYFAIADLIYQNQRAWTGGQNDGAVSANLITIGKTLGFPEDQLKSCLQDQEVAEALVTSYQANATAHGVRSTPSFVINGKLYTNMAYSEFKEILKEAGAE